jgi:hypothetical protein
MFRTMTAARLALAATMCCAVGAFAQSTSTPPTATTPATPAPAMGPVAPSDTDYSKPAVWLCWPGSTGACTQPQDATIVEDSGKLKHEAYHAAKDPAIDCFYVYPTVSTQPTGNSDLTITRAETSVVLLQFARFGEVCRQYAPMYRSITLTALRARLAGQPMTADQNLGYSDVVAAWRYYLEHENKGRGVVLVGHSQGSGVLTRLIRNEIDGKPVQSQIVSAILMGTTLPVPKGADVGGAFKHVPVCHSNSQIHCVIAFADFRADHPPPANSLFGRVRGDEAMQAACANPAALGGGSGKVDAYLSSRRVASTDPGAQQASWTVPDQTIDTPFVKVPGMLTSQCINDEHGSYLAVTVHPSASGKRTGEITGDVMVNGKVLEEWGLHLIDANLYMGNLLTIVRAETKTYKAASKH